MSPGPPDRPPVATPRLRVGIVVFAATAAAATLLLLALTVSRRTIEAFANLQWQWLALTVLLWLLSLFLDGARLSVISHIGPRPLTIFAAVEMITIGLFMAAVTPFQAGGLPLQLYLLNRRGVPPGTASAILLGRGILFYFLLLLAVPFTALRLGVSPLLLRILAGYAGIIVTLGSLITLAGLLFPRAPPALARRLLDRFDPGRVRRFLARVLVEFARFTAGIRLLLDPKHLGRLGLALLLTVIYGLSYYAMSGTLLWGLGVRVGFLPAAGLAMLLGATLISIPTPGSSGVAEAGGAVLYSLVCPVHLVGVFVVLWRFFGFYAGALLGGIFTLRAVLGTPPAAPSVPDELPNA